MSQQTYDIMLQLDLPRSPPNLQAGNFMLDITMMSPAYGLATISGDVRESIPKEAIVFSSRRPAILTYQSGLVSLSKEVAGLPWYVLGLYRNAETLEVMMAEGISFPKGWKNIPSKAYLELQGRGQDIQVYDVKLKLRARFRGLKWFMYNHRIFSFFVGTTAFWATEVSFTVLTWLFLSSKFGIGNTKAGEKPKEETNVVTNVKTERAEEADVTIKTERDQGGEETDEVDMSDTPRSFSTYGRQTPLKYSPKVKAETDGDLVLGAFQPLAIEADDESENPVDPARFSAGRSDSGKTTSFSDAAAGRLRRRMSK
jgi:seipin